ncbi:MAG: exodeoxyribonuclease V subunit gamma [Sedimenticola sp.]|nr:MAG: exodeoxyribonuclease V subunit gamma [Sedimenticola sp.]
MLHLFQSNRLESLADRVARLMHEQPLDPFIPERIVVQHQGMGRWLSLQLADRLGVCSNVEFPMPAGFVWQILERWLPDVPQRNAYDSSLMAWRIMDLLQQLKGRPEFSPVAHYMQNQDEFGQFELAQRLGGCLEEYLVYRPDWIIRWQRGESAVSGDQWQAELWRELVVQTGGEHWVALQQRLFAAHAQGRLRADSLPRRVVLFGIAALSPGYLAIQQLLAEYTDVHLLLLNPCQEYWLDIQDPAGISRRLLESSDVEDLYLEVGNPLLASWGRQGRDFFAQILAFDPGSDSLYQQPESDTLLHRIQGDILNLNDPAGDAPGFIPDQDDLSLQVHICHSPMREVEVLHDQLLALFDCHPDLKADEILVMTPDMDRYAPYVEAIFAETGDKQRIPFGIADRGALTGNTLIEAFLQLLAMPVGRYEVNQMLALLEVPALAGSFGLTPEDIPQLAGWIEQAGIRWGRDAAMRSQLGLPENGQNSWRFGLDRLLLGFALPGGGERLFEDILPFDDIEGSAGELLGGLSAFAEAVFSLEEWLSGRYTLEDWQQRLMSLLPRFFSPDESDESQLQQIRDALTASRDLAMESGFNTPVSIELIRPYLRQQLQNMGGDRRFLGGGVTFCALTPMRSLPFRVVCLIGMNDGAFPKDQRPLGFDLMARDFRMGDRSRRADDRYLFLETINSTRQTLYISYTGLDVRDNSSIPPSVLVSELIDYVKQLVTEDNESNILEFIITQHPLQPFNPRYFHQGERLFSHSTMMADAARVLAADESQPATFFDERPLAEPDASWRQIELRQLLEFYANPTRFLLRQRLGINLQAGEGLLEGRDPFSFGYFESGDLQQQMVERMLADGDVEALYPLQRAAGILPHGQYGEELFRDLEEGARDLARGLQQLEHQPIEPIEVDLQLGEFRLMGVLDDLGSGGQFAFNAKALPARDRVQLWIRHLLLNHLKPVGIRLETRCFHAGKLTRFVPVEDAGDQLFSLLEIYWQGLRQPLHFFPKSAFAYMKLASKGKSDDDCLEAARTTWAGEFIDHCESHNPYYRFAFRDAEVLDRQFQTLSELVLGPMIAATEGE